MTEENTLRGFRDGGKPTSQCRQCHADGLKGYKYFWKYGLTLEALQELIDKQNGKCAICTASFDSSSKTFHVDHDHKCCLGQKTCGKCVRGILCFNCNSGIGQLQDNIDVLQSAISYLNQFVDK